MQDIESASERGPVGVVIQDIPGVELEVESARIAEQLLAEVVELRDEVQTYELPSGHAVNVELAHILAKTAANVEQYGIRVFFQEVQNGGIIRIRGKIKSEKSHLPDTGSRIQRKRLIPLRRRPD